MILRIALLALLLVVPAQRSEAEDTQTRENPKVIEEGNTVSIEYTLKLDDGTTADTNVGEEPLVYQQGEGQILPALERELVGLAVEDTKQVTVPPEQGYGARNPDALQTVEASAIPENARQAGAQLLAQDEQGNRRVVRVHEVTDEGIVLDLNHPLAGENLHFDVKVLAID